MKPKYQVLVAKNEWWDCKKASLTEKGWLHYELSDGTIGLAPEGKFREKPKKV